MKLIDSVDPFFMWHASLSEEDYFVLKREQSLLIDFSRFPYKLIELLQSCVTHSREEHPVYTAWLNVSAGTEDGRRPADAVLSITEATTLRQVAHLSLRFGAVNDATMRKHLAEMVRQYRDEVDGLRSRLYTGVPSAGLAGLAGYGSSGSAGMAGYPSSSYPVGTSGDSVQSLKDRIRWLEEHCGRLEASRFPSSSVPSHPPTFGPRPANVSALEAQLMGLESLLKERTAEMSRLNDIVQGLNDHKRELEQTRAKLQEEISTKEQALQQDKTEITKANEIIKKLQDEIKSLRTRLRTAEAFNRQHEKLTRDSQLTFDTVRNELLELKSAHAARLSDLETTQKQNKELTAQVKELETRLDENTRVTDYLHAELNKQRLDEGNDTLSPEYWARQAALLTQLPPGEETSY